jgi:hypothetical protein
LPTQSAGEWLLYHGNGTATFTVRGVHVRLTVLWDYEPEGGGGDTHESVVRGTRARVSVKPVAVPGGGTRPELFVEATEPANHRALLAAVARRCKLSRERFPDVAVADLGGRLHVTIPASLRTGHEEHFAAVVREFADYFNNRRQLPAWESPNLLAKYHVTTTAVRLARQKQAKPG